MSKQDQSMEFHGRPFSPEERETLREIIWDKQFRDQQRKQRAAMMKVYGAFLSAAAAIAVVASLVRDLFWTKPH